MIITEDGNFDVTLTPGLDYGFSASGEFGGGSVSLEWRNDEENWTLYSGTSFAEPGSSRVRAVSYHGRIVVSDTDSAYLDVSLVRAQDANVDPDSVKIMGDQVIDGIKTFERNLNIKGNVIGGWDAANAPSQEHVLRVDGADNVVDLHQKDDARYCAIALHDYQENEKVVFAYGNGNAFELYANKVFIGHYSPPGVTDPPSFLHTFEGDYGGSGWTQHVAHEIDGATLNQYFYLLSSGQRGAIALEVNATRGVVELETRSRAGVALSGTVAASGNTLTGTGTSFTTQLTPGDAITISNASFVVRSVTSDTSASVMQTNGTIAAATATNYGMASRFVPETTNSYTGATGGGAWVVASGDPKIYIDRLGARVWCLSIGTANSNEFSINNSTGNSSPFLINGDAGNSTLRLTSTGATLGGVLVASNVVVYLKDFYADVATTHTNGTEDDLFSYTTAAGLLAGNGQKVVESEYLSLAASATAARRVRKYFGGTVIWDSGSLTLSGGAEVQLETEIIRESATVVRCVVRAATTSASSVPYATYTRVTGLTLSGTNVLKTTGTASGTGAASGDITAKMGTITFVPAAP